MKDKLFFLTKVSLDRKLKSKWFLVVNILLVLLIVGLLNIDTIISKFGGDFNKETEILVIDNTKVSYETLLNVSEQNKSFLGDTTKFKFKKYIKSKEDAIKEIEKDKKILIEINNDEENYISATITSKETVDTILYQILTTSLSSTKEMVALSMSNINVEELNKVNVPIGIERVILDKENSVDENMDFIMGTIFPVLILPFFMLSIFLVQMIGAEVNDEKTTRGMEIIISNVSPKIHFYSKIIAGNIFVFIQGAILLLSAGLGLVIRGMSGITNSNITQMIDLNSIWDKLSSTGIADRLIIIIPLTLILLILGFIAYSLVAGILASMTTNIEDYQQIQSPIIIISLVGYYLSMMAALFKGALFIRIASYIPFISCLLSPALLMMGQITIIDVLISILLMAGTVWLLMKYGFKIYKVGILNYSSNKLWTKMFKAVKQK